MDFAKDCMFTSEAGFNLHTQQNYGRSRKGTPAKSIIPTGKGTIITILGAISLAGVVGISLKELQAVSASKKRKANGTMATVMNGRVGTRPNIFWRLYPM
jgi:hypothetical protein